MKIKKYAPLLVIVLTVAVVLLVTHYKPEAKKQRAQAVPSIAVETVLIKPGQYQIVLDSHGKVAPGTRGILASQVSGQIISTNPEFSEGGFFEKDALLLTIDPRDYNVQVEIAEAELAEMRVAFEEQQALADQAKKDWSNLGRKGSASDFALRKPQLEAARLKIDSARSKLKQAKLGVDRTRIKMPYRGRVLTKNAAIGDMVVSMSQLAEIYATDQLEIRLSLKNSELPFIELPEKREMVTQQWVALPRATIINSLGAADEHWEATVVRTAGAVEEKSQQLYVTAQIDDPYGADNNDRRPLKIGQFVTAKIEGKVIDNAIIIPNSAIYQGSYIYLVKDELLQRREIRILWQNGNDALIGSGLEGGEQLVLTPLGQIGSGTRVKVVSGSQLKQHPDSR